jgi:hypothetical protein
MDGPSLLDGFADLGCWPQTSADPLPAFRRPTRYALPDGLDLLRRPDGSPWFGLQIVRHQDLSEGSGLLDLGIAVCPTAAQDDPGEAPPIGAPWSAGFLTIHAETLIGDDVLVQIPIRPSGAEALVALVPLPLPAAELLRAALVGEDLLPLEVVIDLEVPGVAARADRRVRFDPRGAVAALSGAAEHGTSLVRPEVLGAIRAAPDEFGLGTTEPPAAEAEAVADRIIARFTTPLAPADAAGLVRHSLPDPSAVPTGAIEWDLAEPSLASRHARAALDPLAAVQRALGGAPAAGLVELRTPPALDAGLRTVEVIDTLPAAIIGVQGVAVRLRLPAAPPHRRQAQTRELPIQPPAADPTFRLRVAPREELAYEWFTAVTPAAPADPRPQLGPPRASQRGRLLVTPADLAVQIVSLTAARSLLVHGSVEAVVRWADAGQVVEWPFVLDRDRPAATVAVPRGAADEARLALRLVAPDQPAPIDLGERRLAPIHLDASSLRELGVQEVTVECHLDPRISLHAVELMSADASSPSAPGVLAFTPQQPIRTWRYVSTSPFRPGFRHRPFSPEGEEPAPWSEVCSPFERLVLDGPAPAGEELTG